jgi:hypothetical protein
MALVSKINYEEVVSKVEVHHRVTESQSHKVTESQSHRVTENVTFDPHIFVYQCLSGEGNVRDYEPARGKVSLPLF